MITFTIKIKEHEDRRLAFHAAERGTKSATPKEREYAEAIAYSIQVFTQFMLERSPEMKMVEGTGPMPKKIAENWLKQR